MAAPFQPPVRTVAELLRRLGDIPADRVRFDPVPGTATRDDLLKPENEGCELVDATLVEKPMGMRESLLAAFLVEFLGPFIRKNNLGILTGEQGTYELCGLVRIPDLAFVSWGRMPGRKLPDDPIPDVVPDLAIEVLSKSNTPSEMSRKREEYFRAGVRIVWEIDPAKRVVRIYDARDQFVQLTTIDTLSGDPVLPGFSMQLSQLFDELDRHG